MAAVLAITVVFAVFCALTRLVFGPSGPSGRRDAASPVAFGRFASFLLPGIPIWVVAIKVMLIDGPPPPGPVFLLPLAAHVGLYRVIRSSRPTNPPALDPPAPPHLA